MYLLELVCVDGTALVTVGGRWLVTHTGRMVKCDLAACLALDDGIAVVYDRLWSS